MFAVPPGAHALATVFLHGDDPTERHNGNAFTWWLDRFLEGGSVAAMFLLVASFMWLANRRANRLVREREQAHEE